MPSGANDPGNVDVICWSLGPPGGVDGIGGVDAIGGVEGAGNGGNSCLPVSGGVRSSGGVRVSPSVTAIFICLLCSAECDGNDARPRPGGGKPGRDKVADGGLYLGGGGNA